MRVDCEVDGAERTHGELGLEIDENVLVALAEAQDVADKILRAEKNCNKMKKKNNFRFLEKLLLCQIKQLLIKIKTAVEIFDGFSRQNKHYKRQCMLLS